MLAFGAVEHVIPERVLLRWAETLAGTARTGLAFTQNQYEQERFDEVLKVAADIKASMNGEANQEDAEGLVEEWMKTIRPGVPGYQTPKVAVGAIVTNDEGQLLMIQRSDSGNWLYPTGWCDVGYSAAEVIKKEVEEETGIIVEPIRIIGVFDGFRLGTSRIPLYSLLFHCKAVGGNLNPHPLEVLDLGWYSLDQLPGMVFGFERWRAIADAAIKGEYLDTAYDAIRGPVWRGEDS